MNFSDMLTLQANFGGIGRTFAQGDANYNGSVDFNDFLLLQSNFGRSLPPLPSQAGGVVVAQTVRGALDIGWTANTDVRDGFKVYRSADNGYSYQLVQTLSDPDARAWRDVGPLAAGQTYRYRVRAYTNAAGASASTSWASGVVTNPTLAAANLKAAGIGPGRVALMWTPPADTPVVSYRVYRSHTPNFLPSAATLVTVTDRLKTRVIDSGVSPGHTYYYKVVVVGAGGSLSMPSLEVAVVAQNQGPGIGNNGTPFGPTHDSDGTADPADAGNDNDGVSDEADPDDDNNGINDNAEPDDRDTAERKGVGSFLPTK